MRYSQFVIKYFFHVYRLFACRLLLFCACLHGDTQIEVFSLYESKQHSNKPGA